MQELITTQQTPPPSDNVFYWAGGVIDVITFKDRLNAHPTLSRCFDERYNLNKHFIKMLEYQTRGENHFVAELIGQQGSGKSRVAQQIAKIISFTTGTPLTINNICFQTKDLLDRCETIPKHSVMIKDEQIVGVGEGAVREVLECQNLIEVTRKYGLSLFFVSPTSRRLPSVHLELEVIQRDNRNRVTKVALKRHGCYLGYITVYIPPDEKDDLYKAYLPIKDNFVETVLKRNLGRLDYNDKAKEILKHPDFRYCKTITDIESIVIELNPTLAISETGRIAKRVRLIERKKEIERKMIENQKSP